MKLMKFSERRKYTDLNGNLTISIDKDAILKISMVELFASTIESFKKVSLPIRLLVLDEIFVKIMSSMDVPQEVSERIKVAIHGQEPIQTQEMQACDGNVNLTQSNEKNALQNCKDEINVIQPTDENIQGRDRQLLDFVSLLVNTESQTNVIAREEFEQIVDGFDMERIVEVLSTAGYSVRKLDHSSLEISKEMIENVPEEKTHQC